MKNAWIIALAGLMFAPVAWAQDDTAVLKQRIEQLEAENARLHDTTQKQAKIIKELDDELNKRQTAAVATEQKLVKAQEQLQEARTQANTLQKQRDEAVNERRSVFVAREFDAASNTTELSTYAMPVKMLKGPRTGHWINLDASYSGKTAASGKLRLGLQTQYSGTIYRGIKKMTINAGGRTIIAPVVQYERMSRVVGGPKARHDRSDEVVQLELSLADVVAIGQSESVTCSLGRAQFELTQRLIKSFAAFGEAMKSGE